MQASIYKSFQWLSRRTIKSAKFRFQDRFWVSMWDFPPTKRSSAVCRLDWNATEIKLTINRFRALEPERSEVLSAVADRSLMVAAFDGPLRSEFGHYWTIPPR